MLETKSSKDTTINDILEGIKNFTKNDKGIFMETEKLMELYNSEKYSKYLEAIENYFYENN